MDPVVKEWESPYACFSNNPVYFSDVLGLDSDPPVKEGELIKDDNGQPLLDSYGRKVYANTNDVKVTPAPAPNSTNTFMSKFRDWAYKIGDWFAKLHPSEPEPLNHYWGIMLLGEYNGVKGRKAAPGLEVIIVNYDDIGIFDFVSGKRKLRETDKKEQMKELTEELNTGTSTRRKPVAASEANSFSTSSTQIQTKEETKANSEKALLCLHVNSKDTHSIYPIWVEDNSHNRSLEKLRYKFEFQVKK